MNDLDQFIDESLKHSKAVGYCPTAFMAMRNRYGNVEAIKRLVKSSDIQSGFKRLKSLGLLDWSLESAVIKYSTHFDRESIEYANFRLKEVQSE